MDIFYTINKVCRSQNTDQWYIIVSGDCPKFVNVLLLFFFLTQCAKTFLNLMAHISKEQTVQYILTLIDDTLQVCQQTHCVAIDVAEAFAF